METFQNKTTGNFFILCLSNVNKFPMLNGTFIWKKKLDETDTFMKGITIRLNGGYDDCCIDFEDMESSNVTVACDNFNDYICFTNYDDAIKYFNENR